MGRSNLSFLTRATIAVTALLCSCNVSIPNGVFSCVSVNDCPDGYYCWNSDGLCYDADEPQLSCNPATCEQVISQFASLGVAVECGMLPDGCDGTVECPPCAEDETCGADGRNFMCGCEEASCSTVEAQCGKVPVGCGSEEEVDCGACPGSLDCIDNQCVCPTGDCECPQGCEEGQTCVQGECCTPLFPCSENECSPPGGLPDGCGGTAVCPSCDGNEQCTPDLEAGVFECVGECTCESVGIECGTTTLCGETQLCGVCESSEAPLCEDGRCVCEDRFEDNDSPASAYELGCSGECRAASLQLGVEATLHQKSDFDFYRVDLDHSEDYGFRVDLSGLKSTRQILMTYVCPDGSEEIADCSGSSSSVGSAKYCIEDGDDTLRLIHECDSDQGTGALIVGIAAKEGEFRGPCDNYAIEISSFFSDFDD